MNELKRPRGTAGAFPQRSTAKALVPGFDVARPKNASPELADQPIDDPEKCRGHCEGQEGESQVPSTTVS